MAYSFDQVFAADPANPSNIAQNASILIYQPGDATKTPLVITDPSGGALSNPVTVNANGFGPAFSHATLDRVAWDGGGFTGFFTSYEGMKNEAIAARDAAQDAATTSAAAAATTVTGATINGSGRLILTKADNTTIDAGSAAGPAGAAGATGAAGMNGSNVLPTDEAIAQAINDQASGTLAALKTSFATKSEVTAIRSYADMPYTPGASYYPMYADITKIAGWGSSSMEQSGPYLATMAQGMGASFYNGGRSSERSEHIAARIGAIPAKLTFPGNMVPASGASAVTVSNLVLTNAFMPTTGTVSGIAGTLTCDGTTWTFTRTTAGTATASPVDTAFIPDKGVENRNAVALLWMGKNDLQGDEAKTIANTKAAFDYLAPFFKKVLVLGHFQDQGTPAVNGNRYRITAINQAYKAMFGSLYLDFEEWVASPAIWTLTGITPTQADLDEQALGNKPPSISLNSGHFNAIGYSIAANRIRDKILSLTWFPGYTGPTAEDLFNRADAASLGTTPTGGYAWTNVNGTMGVVGNQAAALTLGGTWAAATINTTKADGTLSCTFDSNGAGLFFRVGSGNGYAFMWSATTGTYRLTNWPASTELGRDNTRTPVSGDILSVELKGTDIHCKVNGNTSIRITDSTYLTNTNHGLVSLNTARRLDNFKYFAPKV